MKSLADLRKGLVDDVQKLSQQTRDISSAMWKDVAVALGTIGLKVATDASKVSGTSLTIASLAFGIAVYMGASFLMTTRMNAEFIKLASDSRETWRRKLYSFLDDSDFEALATTPISEAVKIYKGTVRGAGIVVAFVVVLLLVFSGWEFYSLWRHEPPLLATPTAL